MPHTYRKLALHNTVCNEVYFRLQDCEIEHPVSRFIGECTSFKRELDKCLKTNLERMRTENNERARKHHQLRDNLSSS